LASVRFLAIYLGQEIKGMFNSIEKMIEEWLSETDCSQLPGAGKPLNLDDYFRWPEEERLGFSLLKSSGFAPVEVEQLGEIGRLRSELKACTDDVTRAQLRRRLQEEEVKLNLNIERARRKRR
jgi:hypothetical protein